MLCSCQEFIEHERPFNNDRIYLVYVMKLDLPLRFAGHWTENFVIDVIEFVVNCDQQSNNHDKIIELTQHKVACRLA